MKNLAKNYYQNIKDLKFFEAGDIELECGDRLENVRVGYHTFGQLNNAKDNVIWVCHALTASSDIRSWWPGLYGDGNFLNPEKYFIVCPNFLGSPYGSTNARSINPSTLKSYGLEMPLITIKDWVNLHQCLSNHLGITQIKFAIGGSCGGHQVLEMCLHEKFKIDNVILLVTSVQETPWSISIHEAQRMTLHSDQSFFENTTNAGEAGLKAARGIGLIAYRTFKQYTSQQKDEDGRYKDFRASDYIQHQGKKLANRFHAHCYFHLINTLDTHNLGRNRNGLEKALNSIQSNCLIISIDTDGLIPVSEQEFIAEHIPNNKHVVISSPYGHDGFLIEYDKIQKAIASYFEVDHLS